MLSSWTTSFLLVRKVCHTLVGTGSPFSRKTWLVPSGQLRYVTEREFGQVGLGGLGVTDVDDAHHLEIRRVGADDRGDVASLYDEAIHVGPLQDVVDGVVFLEHHRRWGSDDPFGGPLKGLDPLEVQTQETPKVLETEYRTHVDRQRLGAKIDGLVGVDDDLIGLLVGFGHRPTHHEQPKRHHRKGGSSEDQNSNQSPIR